jgi:hypothetical protein
MLKKMFLTVISVLLLSLNVAAQPVTQKILVVLNDSPEGFRFMLGIRHVLALKSAGNQVHVVFEGDSVLSFLEATGVTTTPAWKKKMKDIADAPPVSGPPKRPDRRAELTKMNLETPRKQWYTELKRLKIPFTICSFSARTLGVYDELRSIGDQMSPDPDKTVPLAPFIAQDYQVLVF